MSQGKKRVKKAQPGSFGELLFKLRDSQNMTVTELANKSGVSRTYITRLEEGERMPSPQVIRQLSGALDIRPIYLKLTTGQIEFWDIYPVDFKSPPDDYSLSTITKDEQIKLLWFLKYLRETLPA